MGRGQNRFSGEEELDLLVQADKLFERARRLVENGPLAWRVLKRFCCLAWLWPLRLLKDALTLHAAACGPQGQDPFRAEICRLINEIKRRFRKTLKVDAAVAGIFLVVLLLLVPILTSTTTATSTLTPAMSLPTIGIVTPLVTAVTTTVMTPTPTSTATAIPTLIPTPVYCPLVIIDGQRHEVPPADPITTTAKAGSTIRIGILLEDATGQRMPPDQATYQWRFSPPDPENARRVGRLNAELNYTVPTGRGGQLITIDVETAGYPRTIVIQIIIQ